MSKKMQQLLDLIVNEETEKANELFHEIVVEKSRTIYENLIAEEEDEEMDEASEDDDEEMDESAEDDDEEMDESAEDDEEDLEEMFGSDDHGAEDDDMGGDAADDMVGSVEVGHDDDMGGDMDDMGGQDGGAPATKDDVQDLEDALAELKAEFEALMGGEGGEEEPEDDGEANPFGDEDDSEDDSEDDFDDEEDSEEDDEDDEEDESMESMGLREYRETVGNDWEKGSQKAQGVNIGGHTGENYPSPKEGASTVNTNAKATMPNSKANAKNIAQGGKGVGEMTGTSTNADKGSRGLVGNTQGEFTKGVTKNLANSAKAKMKDGASLEAVKKGHGAERKGTTPGPVGSGTGDKAGQTSDAQGSKKPFLQPYKK